jgi:serpin B
MNQGFNLNPDFVRKANYYYDAYPQTRDFHDPQTLTEINQWASDHTEHMIEKVLDNDFNENAVSYLLNAIYFKGSWTYKFDKSRTKVEDFIFPDETDGLLSCNMMQMHSDIDYAVTDQYQAVRLPYGNGSFQMTVLLHKIQQTDPPLPIVELDLRPTVPTLEQWQEINRNMSQREVMLKMPRFETESKIDLIEIMKRLGMTDAFIAEDADFSNFCDVPTYIGLMKQVAKIKLDEEGTEAAAVTVIGVDWTSEAPSYISFIANRPFIYVISEKKSGAIFFIGQYTGH